MSLRAGLAYESIRQLTGDDHGVDPSVPVLVDLRCERQQHLLARVYQTASGPLLAATSGRRPVPLPPPDELYDENGKFRYDVGPAGPILLGAPVEEDGRRGYGAASGEVSFGCRCGAPKIERERVVRAARRSRSRTVKLLVPIAQRRADTLSDSKSVLPLLQR